MAVPLLFVSVNRRPAAALAVLLLALGCSKPPVEDASAPVRPHVVLVMADDMGWGQTGYYDHPVLETPSLDAMAANGLRFDRFYAGGPVCSPTRATVMTGRQHDRTGVAEHGYALRRQERTVAQAMRAAGYATGHFGKWHLNGLRGPGVPVLSTDTHHPGTFGFDTWLSVTNFFDMNPLMSRQGTFEEFVGDSSEIIVGEALKFIRARAESGQPSFTVIWYGSPHSPFAAAEADLIPFPTLKPRSQRHYGELVAMDRSIGALRQGLRDIGIAEHTLVWFNSDNGGLAGIEPDTVGGLRGFKGQLYEGGIRVPAVIEWPAGIPAPRVTAFPSATMDIFPTLADVLDLPEAAQLQPGDGVSIAALFESDLDRREQPIPFHSNGRAAMIDNEYKLITQDTATGEFELYDLDRDPNETTDLYASEPLVAQRLRETLATWLVSLKASVAGEDYPEGRVDPDEPGPRFWMTADEYAPYLDELTKRPEYAARIERGR
jgi:arylsulfatase A-like enzyme